jgi:hypothetical protein
MNSLWRACVALTALGGLAFCVERAALAVAAPPGQAGAQSSEPKVMREYRGIKLGLKSTEVRAALGKPESASDNRDEYKIGGEDLLTVHYDNGVVRAIQLYFTDAKNAPSWAEVVGDAEIKENENGAKQARVIVSKENFWVSMFQNKEKTVTTITISR